jgi:flagellar M-ring protein FliF
VNGEGINQSFRDLPLAWSSMGRSRQIGFAVGAVVVIAALFGAFVYLQPPATVPLYTNLAEGDAAAIVAKLKEFKAQYTITDGGQTIRVPFEQAADLRLQLASAGLPSGTGVGVVGMEVFDRTNLGITDFAQRLNYQRGLEGELMRTIGRISAVDQARVHLVLPQERLFAAQQRDASASVVIKTKSGAKLADDQVTSIKFLVSKAVEGLKAENVAVVDSNGNTLGKADTSEIAANKQASARLDVQHSREAEIERKVQALLDQALGKGRAVVKATVALDWDTVAQTVETYSPSQLQPQTRSQKDSRESFAGTGPDAQAAGGVPGTQTNIPSFQQGGGYTGGGGNSSYQKSEVTTNYEVSSDKRAITRAAGEIKSVGIAVMVDQAVQNIQAEQLTQAVSAAVGLQTARGDQIAVVTVPFDTTLAKELEAQAAQAQQNDYIQMGVKAGGLLAALIGLFVVFRLLSSSIKPKPVTIDGNDLSALPSGRGGAAALVSRESIEAQLAALLGVSSTPELPDNVLSMLPPEERARYLAAKNSGQPYEVPGHVMATLPAEAQAVVSSATAAAVAAAAGGDDATAPGGRRRRQLSPSERAQRREEVRLLAREQPGLVAETLARWIQQENASVGVS